MNDSESIPLCVDLDGTLVKLDTLHQALFLLLRRDFTSIFRIPGWILKGKAFLKEQVMQRITLDASALPYHREFLAYLRKEHEAGRTLVLATASNYRTANAVAEHLGIFSDTISSTVETNMRHTQKLAASAVDAAVVAPLDVFLLSLAQDAVELKNHEGFSDAVPDIKIATEPTILLSVIGKPFYKPMESAALFPGEQR